MRCWRWWLVGLLIVAFWLRLPGLFANHFHADEALFASWSRLIAVWRDPLLVTQAVDKPPLLFYLQALFYPLFGPVEWAARMPNLIASLLLIPLTAQLGRALYRDPLAALAAAIFLTCAPLAIQFSPTAFIDPLLTTLLVAALLALVGRRPGWAGIWLGLALATKYQALLFVPLLLGLSWLNGSLGRDTRRFLLGLLPALAGLLAWEWARSGELALWSNQIGNFGGLRLSWSWELWPRLQAWLSLWRLSLGGWLLLALLGGVLVGLLLRSTRVADRASAVDLLLSLFVIGYGAFHWLAAIPVWDRYLLPLLPLAALILGRGMALIWRWDRRVGGVSAVGLGILLLLPAVQARRVAFPLGGSPTADQGAHEIAAYLADAPYGTVLYDHWYSWHWGYHLFDTGVYVSWFPHGTALAEDLAVFGTGDGQRLIALPDGPAALAIQRAVASAGFTLQPILHTTSETGIILWEITEADRGLGVK